MDLGPYVVARVIRNNSDQKGAVHGSTHETLAKTKPKRAIIQFASRTPLPAIARRRVHQLHILSLQERKWVC